MGEVPMLRVEHIVWLLRNESTRHPQSDTGLRAQPRRPEILRELFDFRRLDTRKNTGIGYVNDRILRNLHLEKAKDHGWGRTGEVGKDFQSGERPASCGVDGGEPDRIPSTAVAPCPQAIPGCICPGFRDYSPG